MSFSEIKSGTVLVVLPPKLVYESAGTESLLDGSHYGSTELGDDLVRSALTGLRPTATAVVDSSNFHNELGDSPRLAAELEAASDQLLRATLSEQLLAKLRRYGGDATNAAVVVQYFKIKIGPGGSWDANTGQITSAMHSGHLRVSVLDCKTGRLLWHNQFYLREIPRPTGKNYRTAVNSLYQNTPPEK